MIHDAQEIAILDGREVLDISTLNDAYKQRMNMLHDYIQPCIKTMKQTTKSKPKKQASKMVENKITDKMISDVPSIQSLVKIAKENGEDILDLLQQNFNVEVISC